MTPTEMDLRPLSGTEKSLFYSALKETDDAALATVGVFPKAGK